MYLSFGWYFLYLKKLYNMEQKFKSGDVVMLKSGGRKMTVLNHLIEYLPNNLSKKEFIGNYICIWYDVDNKKDERYKYHQDLLKIVPTE